MASAPGGRGLLGALGLRFPWCPARGGRGGRAALAAAVSSARSGHGGARPPGPLRAPRPGPGRGAAAMELEPPAELPEPCAAAKGPPRSGE